MIQIVSPEYITFTTLIFIHALGTSGIYPTAFILGKLIEVKRGLYAQKMMICERNIKNILCIIFAQFYVKYAL